MELNALLKTWVDLPVHIKTLGMTALFLILSFLAYQINRASIHSVRNFSSEEKPQKSLTMNPMILAISALMGFLGFIAGTGLVPLGYNRIEYFVGMTLMGLFTLSAVYTMGAFEPGVQKVVVSDDSYFKRLTMLPVMVFKTLYTLLERMIRTASAPGDDIWGILMIISLLALLPLGFIVNEVFLKIFCLTLGGMGLALSFFESLTQFFNYSFFPESVINKQRLFQLILGAMGFFLGVLIPETLVIDTFSYHLILSGIAGFFIGVAVGIPLSQAPIYYQQLHRQQERHKQSEKSEVEKILARIPRHMEDYRRLVSAGSQNTASDGSLLAELDKTLQAIKTEALSGTKAYRELKEKALQLENQLKDLIRDTHKARLIKGERLSPSMDEMKTIRVHTEDQNVQEDRTDKQVTRPSNRKASGPDQPQQQEQSSQQQPQEPALSLEEARAVARQLIEQLKTKSSQGGAILSNTLALEARLNGLDRKIEGRRISPINAQTEANKIKDAAEALDYFLASTESAEEIKPLTEEECREVLNVSAEATKEEIRKAYKQLAILYHPDKYVNSPPKMKEQADKAFKKINEAYQILTRQTDE
jgi:hypothetical protein